MLSPEEVLSTVVLCSVVLGSCEVDSVELSPMELGSVELASEVLSSVKLCPDELGSVDVGSKDVDSDDSCSVELGSEVLGSVELGPVELSADELSSMDVVARDVDSDDIDSVELEPALLGSMEADSMDVDSDASDDADAVGSMELDVTVSEAAELNELEEGSSVAEPVRDEASELIGRELVAPGELDCVPLVSGRLEVVRMSLVEVPALCLRLSDSLLALLVCSSEDAEDIGLLASEVLASEVAEVSIVLSPKPGDELDSVPLL